MDFPNMFFFPQHHWKYLHAGFNYGFTHCHLLSRFCSVYALGLAVIRDKTRAGAKKKEPKSLLVSLWRALLRRTSRGQSSIVRKAASTSPPLLCCAVSESAQCSTGSEHVGEVAASSQWNSHRILCVIITMTMHLLALWTRWSTALQATHPHWKPQSDTDQMSGCSVFSLFLGPVLLYYYIILIATLYFGEQHGGADSKQSNYYQLQ